MNTHMSNMFCILDKERTTRQDFDFILPSFHYTQFKYSFKYRACIIWNNLPACLKCIKCNVKFRTEMKKYLLMNTDKK